MTFFHLIPCYTSGAAGVLCMSRITGHLPMLFPYGPPHILPFRNIVVLLFMTGSISLSFFPFSTHISFIPSVYSFLLRIIPSFTYLILCAFSFFPLLFCSLPPFLSFYPPSILSFCLYIFISIYRHGFCQFNSGNAIEMGALKHWD